MKIASAVVLVVCAALVGCVSPLTQEQRRSIHSIGILSLFGDRVTLSFTGMITASHDKIPVADAQFDALAEKAVIDCGKASDLTRDFKRIAIPKQPLMDKLYGGILALYNATTSEIRPDVAAWVKQNPVDAVILIRELNMRVRGRGPEQYFDGLGLHQLMSYPPLIQGAFGMVIWDANLQQIATLAAAPAAGDYAKPIQTVHDELTAGKRIPLIPILQGFVQNDICKMIKRANL